VAFFLGNLSAVAHWPKSHSSDCGVSTRRVYNAMLSFADAALGNLTTLLQQRGMWANTLLVWHSDNGGPSGSSSNSANNWPLRGAKYSDFEGGVRVRAFVAGGMIPPHRAGVTVDAFLHVCDWVRACQPSLSVTFIDSTHYKCKYACLACAVPMAKYSTFLRLAGASLHDPSADAMGLPQPDSIDAWDVLMGIDGGASASNHSRTEVPLSFGDAASGAKPGSGGGLIVPPFKILLGNQTPQGCTPQDYPSATHILPTYPAGEGKTLDCGSSGCLFNVVDDPNENVSRVHRTQARLTVNLRAVDSYQPNPATTAND
jgi:arylsulfatase B